jgi:hypothetical protein
MRALLLLLLCANAGAIELRKSREVEAWSVSAAYYGEMLLHPGVVVGAERSLKMWGPRRGLVAHGFFVEGDLGGYWHARYNADLFFSTELGYRMILPRGFRLELLGGLGYLHAFDDGTVYEVQNGQVRSVAAAGHPSLMMRGMVGIGWDFTVGNHAPFAIFLRAGTFGQYPYNTAVLPHLEAQLGFSLPLGRLRGAK